MLLRWFKQPGYILAHLVPLGTPGILIPFIVMIEIVRALIRPLTLSVRLAANIIAGHLLLTLLRAQGPHLPPGLTLFLLRALVVLRMLETAVAVIQAYVFRVLSTLYLGEVNTRAILK
jgi:F-type H+-transporting ATPase subunit a